LKGGAGERRERAARVARGEVSEGGEGEERKGKETKRNVLTGSLGDLFSRSLSTLGNEKIISSLSFSRSFFSLPNSSPLVYRISLPDLRSSSPLR